MHSRRSIRLPEYDYTQEGGYYITICIHNKKCFLGNIQKNTVQLSQAGEMVEYYLQGIPNKYPHISIGEYVIMPNHIHFIMNVGATQCGRPDKAQCGRPDKTTQPSIGMIIGWFKTITTNYYIRGVKQGIYQSYDTHFWQRNYYEHIIRDDKDLFRIYEYIRGNPFNWKNDEMYHDI
jgi:REP element-mobilizing transposase RayT